MKTEQEIKESAENYCNINDWHNSAEIIKAAFISGAQFAAPKWIPVEEALPKEDSFIGFWSETVYVTDGQFVEKAYYHFDWRSWILVDNTSMIHVDDISHFMEIYIPQPFTNDQKSEL